MDEQRKKSLLDYAQYLQQLSTAETDAKTEEKQQPLESPRPDNENVINAIKRLRASYFMLDADELLNETSSLMAQFMVQGRAAEEVIDDMEKVFDNHYKKYLQS